MATPALIYFSQGPILKHAKGHNPVESAMNILISLSAPCEFLNKTPVFIILSVLWIDQAPSALNHPQIIIETPPCFTVGTVFLGRKASPVFLQIWRFAL